MTLPTLKSRLIQLNGVKKYAAAFGLGALMTLALPPVGFFFILLVSVPGFIWLARTAKNKKQAFLTGWAFGAGYFIFGLYWISFALFVDLQDFGWVLPLSTIAGPAAFALYYGLIPLLVWRYRKHETLHALMMVAAWGAIEWLRGHALTGFPWNLPGYTWNHLPPLLQVNAAVGIYGLTLLTLFWAATPALPKKWAPLLIASFLMVEVLGVTRMSLNPPASFSHTAVRVVQPNIPQTLKWSQQEETRNLQHLMDLTSTPAKEPITFVIWPETAVTLDLKQNPDVARIIGMNLPADSIGLLGSLRTTGPREYFNSVTALDKGGHVLATYSKHHLVPFGEYIPFRSILNMTPVASGIAKVGDFTPGEGVSTLHLGALPKPSPLVCYEVIFPGAVANSVDRPDWLVNVTNDAWYGKTAGPHQHFEIARVRAVEEGLPLVRAANTGISAVVDPLGRIVSLKELGKSGIIDAELPKPLPPTLYAKFGDTLFFLMLVLLALTTEVTLPRK